MHAPQNGIVNLRLSTGQKIRGFKQDFISKEIEKNGCFDPYVYLFLLNFVQKNPDATVLDVGANIGSYTLPLAKHAKKVLAFEPVPETFKLLKYNIEQNNLQNVTAYNVGLLDQAKTDKIYCNTKGNIGASSLYSGGVAIDIRLEVGDNFLKAGGCDSIDMIKIDVEGCEALALFGLKGMIAKCRPVIVMEWNSDKTREGFSKMRLWETMFEAYDKRALISSNGLNYSETYKIFGLLGVLMKIDRTIKRKKRLKYSVRVLYRPILLFLKKRSRQQKIDLSLLTLKFGDFNPSCNYEAIILTPNTQCP